MTRMTKQRAEEVFREHGPVLRTRQALDFGIHPETLYEMHKSGQLVRVGRGVYRLADAEFTEMSDLAAAAIRVPQGVVCLVSALAFHNITTQIPHEVSLALPRPRTPPRVDYPPLRVFTFSRAAYEAGIEAHRIDGVSVRVYNPAKTVADCFKFRNKIGLDVTIEALRLCRERKHITPRLLLKYARVCRVERVMMPYLEALA